MRNIITLSLVTCTATIWAQNLPREVDENIRAMGFPSVETAWSVTTNEYGAKSYIGKDIQVFCSPGTDRVSMVVYSPKRTDTDDGRTRLYRSMPDVVQHARARLRSWDLDPSWVATVAETPDPQNTEPAHWTVLFRDTPPAPAVGVGINNMICRFRMRDGQMLVATRSARVTYEPAGELVSEAEIRSKAQAMGAAPDATIYLQYRGLNEAQQALVGRTVPKLTVVLAYVVNLENRTQAVFEARTGIHIETMGPGSAATPAPPAEQPKAAVSEVKAQPKAAAAPEATRSWLLPVGIVTVLAGMGAFVFKRARTKR